MPLKKYRAFFTAVCLSILLVVAVLLVRMIVPPENGEPFLVISILGENKTAEHYYPYDKPNIEVGIQIRWYALVHNHMGESQYISVQLKILNSTLPSPNDLKCTPSSVPFFFEFRHSLASNETLWLPLYWYISEAKPRENSIAITQLVINNVTLPVNVSAVSGYNFRMVFELWVYDKTLQKFKFDWESGQRDLCAWNQIWFNVTA